MNDTWYYIDCGEERGPVSLAKLKELRSINVIVSDTAVRLADSQDWEQAENVPGLFWPVVDTERSAINMPPKLMNCGVCKGAMASNATGCPHCGAPNPHVQSVKSRPSALRPRSSWSWRRRATTSAVLLTLALLLFLLSGWLSGASGARRSLQRELDKWRAGKSSAAVSTVSIDEVPVLLDYEILGVESDSEIVYSIKVNLTFSSGIGGRPVQQHKYLVAKDGVSGSWNIMIPYGMLPHGM